jgi:tRNA splicing ligase
MASKKVKDENKLIESIENAKEIISEIKKEIEEPISEKIKDDEVFIPTKGLVKIKPTKLKYFKNGTYNNYMLIKNIGIHELLRYDDGDEILKDFISAVLDIEKNTIDFIDEMSTKTLFDIIEKANKINEIKDTDFLERLQEVEAMVKEE